MAPAAAEAVALPSTVLPEKVEEIMLRITPLMVAVIAPPPVRPKLPPPIPFTELLIKRVFFMVSIAALLPTIMAPPTMLSTPIALFP